MRLTIPKSQGKQAYYDARKCTWGDIFPHQSKLKEVERYRPPVEGAGIKERKDVVKRGANADDRKIKHSYETLEADIKDRKKDKRRERQRERSQLFDLD